MEPAPTTGCTAKARGPRPQTSRPRSSARARGGAAAAPLPGQYLHDPREGLASAFVYSGALGCVGALWPVDDAVAASFAIAFYREVLDGQRLGDAMLAARQSTARAERERAGAGRAPDPTWAAFVLYGDPLFTLPAATRLEPAENLL